MRQALKLHPDSRCVAVQSIEVEIVRPRADALVLRYFVMGHTSGLRLPALAEPTRRDELWRHTCFEAFILTPPSDGYYEFNFAPSTRWAAYRFSGYRDGMTIANKIVAPRIDVKLSAERYEIEVSLDLNDLALPKDSALRLGVSAVIEETNGDKSYWALAHPPGKADFHHRDGFTLELPVLGQT